MGLSRQGSWIVFCVALLTACGSGSGGSTPSVQGTPLVQTRATFPYGDLLCAGLSPDHRLAFVSEGASLALLDVSSTAPSDAVCLKTRLPIDVSCFAIVPVDQRVFLAAGKLGLFALTTCPNLGDSCSAGCASYPLDAIDAVPDKICIALAVAHATASGDLLLALYSAKDDSELRVYDLADPHVVRAIVPVQGGAASQAFALAVDPLDPNRAYAAMGRGGLVRIALQDLAHVAVEQGPIFAEADQVWYGDPASARDLSIAGGFMYAAIDKGGLAEVDLSTPWSASMAYDYQTLGCGTNTAAFAYRVATVTDDTGRILIAVGTHESAGQNMDGGPFSLLGAWSFDLVSGNVPDLPPGSPNGCDPRLYLFQRTRGGSGGGTSCSSPTPCPVAMLDDFPNEWRSLSLRRQGSHYQVCECHRQVFRIMDLGTDPFSAADITYTEVGASKSIGLGTINGAVSSLNPNVLFLGNDPLGTVFAGVPQIGAGDSTIDVVAHTNGLCASPPQSAVYCDTRAAEDSMPNPYLGGLYCSAHWIDTADPTREWVVSGIEGVWDQCAAPCAYSDQYCSSIWKSPVVVDRPRPGWTVVSVHPNVTDGSAWQFQWWQLPSPAADDGNAGRNYIGSAIDARPGSTLLHLTRSCIRNGYVVCDGADVAAAAEQLCTTANGRGQEVASPWMHVLPTHLEFAQGGSGCDGAENFALTLSCHVFPVAVGDTQRWVAALAAGHPANPCADASWTPYYQRAMLVLYDVTTVDAQTPPTLLRVAFGPAGTQGNALAVRTATIAGRTYAFVADIGGRLLVFDVSGDVLFPPPANPALPSTGLATLSTWTSPVSAFDGFREDVIDVEVDLPYAYLATGRRGVTVVDVGTNILQPHEIAGSPIPTPGLAEGVVLRKVDGESTLVVGDARAGLRLLGAAAH
jgi:hypothetical protein